MLCIEDNTEQVLVVLSAKEINDFHLSMFLNLVNVDCVELVAKLPAQHAL